jgi:hypothetical protein
VATILGEVTLNEVFIVSVAGDPTISGGTPSPVGSLALDSTGVLWQKTGPLDTAWTALSFVGAGGVTYGSPVTIGTANADGVSTSVARSDHVHAHGNQTLGTLHAVATAIVNGFMSATDKTKLDALKTKAGRVAAGAFTGNPKKATITFTTAFPTTNYTITIIGVDSRSWSYESKAVGSFVINTNANAALTSEVSWQAQLDGEV